MIKSSLTKGFRTRYRFALRIIGVAVLAVVVLAPSAFAGTTYAPDDNGVNNAEGFGIDYTQNDYHDIDRKVCGFWGCNWSDGSNVYYGSNGQGFVYRGKACGDHRYRHQSSDGDTATATLTRNCE